MKRRLFWLLAIGGAIWLYLKRGARRPEPVSRVPAPAPAPTADPAEELRRKLEQTKEQEPPVSYPSEPDPAPAEVLGVEQPDDAVEPSAPVVSEELDARRREIHERARSAADEMQGTSSDSSD
jgi:hypothetical protein